MPGLFPRAAFAVVLMTALPFAVHAAGDPAAGKALFQSTCSICHSVQPGQNKIGPTLFGVVGRKTGSVPGYTVLATKSGRRSDLGRGDVGQVSGSAAGDDTGNENDLWRPEGCRQARRPDRLSRHIEIDRGGWRFRFAI